VILYRVKAYRGKDTDCDVEGQGYNGTEVRHAEWDTEGTVQTERIQRY